MIMRALLAGVSLGFVTGVTNGQVVLHRTEGTTLAERIRVSSSHAPTRVGYAFRRLMEPNNFISTGWTSYGNHTSTRTLEQMLASAGDPGSTNSRSERRAWQPDERMAKRVAVLFRVSEGVLASLEYQTTDLAYDSSGGPLLWMGEVGGDESFEFLSQLYERTGDRLIKERAVRLIGLHQRGSSEASAFLRQVLAGKEDASIRRNAANALGDIASKENLQALATCVRQESSSKVARAAVWAVAGQQSGPATDTLVALFHENTSGSVRREILQAIAQRATERALPILQDVIDSDPDVEVRRMAVWSLANLPDDTGVPLLITLARTDGSPTVRKAAIQALAQSKDERATQALIDIVRKP